jgi:hypothetical protein
MKSNKSIGFEKGVHALRHWDFQELKGFLEAIQFQKNAYKGDLRPASKLDEKALNEIYKIRYTDKYKQSIDYLTKKELIK